MNISYQENGTIDNIIECRLEKPFEMDRLCGIIDTSLEDGVFGFRWHVERLRDFQPLFQVAPSHLTEITNG